MDLSLVEKFVVIIKFMFSSFMGIGIFLINLLLILNLIFNINKNVKVYTICILIFVLSFYSFILMGFHEYTYQCVKSLFKFIMNYIYFPSTIVYFFMTFIVILLLFYSVVKKNLSKFKRCFNYIFMGLYILLYSLFLDIVIGSSLNIADKVGLYENNVVLSIVQVSNLVFVLWILITVFYYLYSYFKKNFD